MWKPSCYPFAPEISPRVETIQGLGKIFKVSMSKHQLKAHHFKNCFRNAMCGRSSRCFWFWKKHPMFLFRCCCWPFSCLQIWSSLCKRLSWCGLWNIPSAFKHRVMIIFCCLMLFPFANIQCYVFCWTCIWRFCLDRFVGSFDMFWQLVGLQHHLINNIGVQRSIGNPNFALGFVDPLGSPLLPFCRITCPTFGQSKLQMPVATLARRSGAVLSELGTVATEPWLRPVNAGLDCRSFVWVLFWVVSVRLLYWLCCLLMEF